MAAWPWAAPISRAGTGCVSQEPNSSGLRGPTGLLYFMWFSQQAGEKSWKADPSYGASCL